jgi:hypothetical protein
MHKYKMMLFGGVSKNGKIAGSGRQQERFGVTMPVSRDNVFLCSSMSKRNLFAIFEAHNDCLATFFKDQKKFLIEKVLFRLMTAKAPLHKEIEDKGESKLLSLEVPGSPRVLFAREKTSSTVGSNSRKVLRRERTRGAQHFGEIATKNVSSAVPANKNKRSTFQKRFSICPEPERPIPGSAFRTHRQ